ncbi:hypothetical protein [Actinopolyspora alba]|uniref:hypothetical protein n=1 Tax=Actinopolyspora alba TaxID=673379 RepID=UPI0011135DEF|nr:hypothetical protein [Actinopolyspora alba]
MTPPPSAWQDLALHWHAHVDLRASCSRSRRGRRPVAVLFTPQAAAAWLAGTVQRYRSEAVAVQCNTATGPAPSDTESRDSCGDHLLSRGYPLDALILTTSGELYLHLDPLGPRECPYHRPERSEHHASGDNHVL